MSDVSHLTRVRSGRPDTKIKSKTNKSNNNRKELKMDSNYKAKERWTSIIPMKDDNDLRRCYKNLVKRINEKEQNLGDILSDKLRKRHIYFVTIFTLVSSLIDFKKSFENCEHLILIDTVLFKKLFDDDDEKCALILHELGHIFNRPKDSDVPRNFQDINEDHYADDFARKLGFQKELLSSLKKYKEWKIKNCFEVNEVYNSRIKRIEENDEIKDGIEI